MPKKKIPARRKTRSKKEPLAPITDAQINLIMDTFMFHVNFVYQQRKKISNLKSDFVPTSLLTLETMLRDAQRAALIQCVTDKL